jgi:hypothetical protein
VTARNIIPSDTVVDRPPVPETTVIKDKVAKARVFRATLVQHGHTPAEQLLYLSLWNNGHDAKNGSREITAGYRQLAHLANLNDKTVKFSLQSLIQKLAIQVIAEEHVATRTGRTYCVYSYEQILARRNRAGLLWVRKNKGVEFVEPPTAVDRPTVVQSPSLPQGIIAMDSGGSSTTVGRHPSVSVGSFSPATEGSFTTPLGSSGNRNQTSTTDVSQDLLQGLRRLVPTIDDQAVLMLWAECQARAADCSPEEVMSFVNAKASIALNGKIQNPVGFLLTAVPKCFEGAAFVAFREDQRRRKEEEAKRRAREDERLKALQDEAREEAEAYENGKRLLQRMSKSEYQALYQRTKNELFNRYPNVLRSAPKTMEDLVQREMIRRLKN